MLAVDGDFRGFEQEKGCASPFTLELKVTEEWEQNIFGYFVLLPISGTNIPRDGNLVQLDNKKRLVHPLFS